MKSAKKPPASAVPTENDPISHLERLTRLLRARELAELIGWSQTQVYRLTERNRIPHIRIAGSVRYNPAAIARWLRSGESAA